jgi:hypothetical protein
MAILARSARRSRGAVAVERGADGPCGKKNQFEAGCEIVEDLQEPEVIDPREVTHR